MKSAISNDFEKTVSNTSLNFKNIAQEWLNTRQHQIKRSTYSRYKYLLETYLFPVYQTQEINQISRKSIILFYNHLLTEGGKAKKPLSPKTINCILSVLKNVFHFAEQEKRINVEEIYDIFLKQPQKNIRVLSYNEQKILTSFLFQNPTPCNIGILLSLYSGIRIGEMSALKWEDIEYDEKSIYIHKTMQRIQNYDNSAQKTSVIIQSPKSFCAIRHIPVPDDIFKFLIRNQKQEQAYILTGKPEAFMEPRTLENRFQKIMCELQIYGTTYHTLRHTFATRCVELGFDVKSLSEILGHANVSVTLNRYVHPSMEMKRKNMELLSGLLVE